MNVPTNEISVNNLPEDSASLKAMLREVLAKLESVSADQQHEKRLAEQLRQRADDLYLENLRLQQELERYKKADRKSTRLNSSHGYISYAVFCLKKKKRENVTVPCADTNQQSRPVHTLHG